MALVPVLTDEEKERKVAARIRYTYVSLQIGNPNFLRRLNRPAIAITEDFINHKDFEPERARQSSVGIGERCISIIIRMKRGIGFIR